LNAIFGLLPLGFMMFSMITINEIPDEKDDSNGGKNTLVVKLGALAGVWLYGLSFLIAYIIIFISPFFQLTSYWNYLALITFPWFVKAFYIALKNYQIPIQLSSANVLTIKIHNLTGILIISAYIIDGYLRYGSLNQMIIPIMLLFVLYLPVALTIFFNYMPIKPASKPDQN
jgi:1,4-dihydroxy-2-naphthoate polyprenyltransferase